MCNIKFKGKYYKLNLKKEIIEAVRHKRKRKVADKKSIYLSWHLEDALIISVDMK